MKFGKYIIFLILILFIFLHFYQLSNQEFVGDEASPIYYIDRMWDAFPLHDVRFLAYPFLFYTDPFRAIFSGTLLHFIGPNRIILRLPSIGFAILNFGFLIFIFKKEKIYPLLLIFSILAYALSALTINDRQAGGDSQTRFLFLFISYTIWKNRNSLNTKNFYLILSSLMLGILTMLDSLVLVPAVTVIFLRNFPLFTKKQVYVLAVLVLFLCLYFIAWTLLPILAYKFGFQHYLSNRGLFYYFSRVSVGTLLTPLNSVDRLTHYTNLLFTLWMIITLIFSFKIKKYLLLNLISVFAWISVLFLNRSGDHVIMYVSFFFFQAVIVTDYIIKKYPIVKLPVVLILLLIALLNASNLLTNYTSFFNFKVKKGQVENTTKSKPICLDEAVIRIYKSHAKIPHGSYCLNNKNNI